MSDDNIISKRMIDDKFQFEPHRRVMMFSSHVPDLNDPRNTIMMLRGIASKCPCVIRSSSDGEDLRDGK